MKAGRAGMLSLRATALGMAILLGSIAPGKWAETARVEANHETSVAVPTLDRFGGMDIKVSDARGYFRVEKIGDRWVFVTPEGNPFWLLGVYVLDWGDGGAVAQDVFKTKYKGDQFSFAIHALKRLRAWGFNTVGEYASSYAIPVPLYYRQQGNPEKMPFIRHLNTSWYGALNEPGKSTARWDLAPQPFKTLLAGAVDTTVYRGWPGHVPDVFDPNFETFARNLAADLKTSSRPTIFTEKTNQGGLPHPSLVKTPWLLGTTPDDADYVFGMGGPGPEVPGINGVIHPHLGWIVAVTKPFQTENGEVGKAFGVMRVVTYTDPVVYAKRAWRDFLRKQYETIEALNAAWGSSYATFDSDGGWPLGKGLLDESGRNPWIGADAERLSTAAPKVVEDLNAFLELFAEKYFSIVTSAVRAATPNHLVFSPAMLNGHKGLTRREILRAAGKYCDVIQVNVNPDKPELIGLTYELTRRPLFSWVGITANPDSAMFAHPRPRTAPSQEGRGKLYKQLVDLLLSYQAPDGTYPMVGLDWWEYMDKWGEKANWGLVSPRHNAYDGKEAVRAQGKDPWGYPTGGEERDYGDFLTTVRETNLAVQQRLRDELEAGKRHAQQKKQAVESPP